MNILERRNKAENTKRFNKTNRSDRSNKYIGKKAKQ